MKDYLKKEPSRTERALYEMAMHLQHLDRSLVSTSAHIVALGLLLDVKAEKVADILVNGNDKIKEYGQAINAEIDKLEGAKKSKIKEESGVVETEEKSE